MSSTNAHLFQTTPLRHQALTTRNSLAHNAFIYSVTTTKIYCRPTCSSRLARRSNILFHDNSDQAAAAGFRACKRCKPDCDGGDAQVIMCQRVCGLIRDEIEGRSDEEYGEGKEKRKWSVKSLAREVGVTESHFCRVFKKITGMTVGQYRQVVESKKSGENKTMDQRRSIRSDSQSSHGDVSTPYEDFLAQYVVKYTAPSKMQDWMGQSTGSYEFESTIEADCFEFVDFDARSMM